MASIPRGGKMIFYVKSGGVDAVLRASSARAAAVKAFRNSDACVAPMVMVNSGGENKEIDEDSIFFLSESILDDCQMKLVR